MRFVETRRGAPSHQGLLPSSRKVATSRCHSSALPSRCPTIPLFEKAPPCRRQWLCVAADAKRPARNLACQPIPNRIHQPPAKGTTTTQSGRLERGRNRTTFGLANASLEHQVSISWAPEPNQSQTQTGQRRPFWAWEAPRCNRVRSAATTRLGDPSLKDSVDDRLSPHQAAKLSALGGGN